jgi:hypothetical protein
MVELVWAQPQVAHHALPVPGWRLLQAHRVQVDGACSNTRATTPSTAAAAAVRDTALHTPTAADEDNTFHCIRAFRRTTKPLSVLWWLPRSSTPRQLHAAERWLQAAVPGLQAAATLLQLHILALGKTAHVCSKLLQVGPPTARTTWQQAAAPWLHQLMALLQAVKSISCKQSTHRAHLAAG